MFRRLQKTWRAWRLKRKRNSLEAAYRLGVAKLAEQIHRLPPKSRAVSYRLIWLKEVERRLFLVNDKIAALDLSQDI